MSQKLYSLFVITVLLLGSLARADSPDFETAIGTVDKFDKESVVIILAEKSKKTIELKITAPQVRSGKTVITQRKAEAADLAKGQFVAVIYAEADNEYVLLNAVLKPIEKPVEKQIEKSK